MNAIFLLLLVGGCGVLCARLGYLLVFVAFVNGMVVMLCCAMLCYVHAISMPWYLIAISCNSHVILVLFLGYSRANIPLYYLSTPTTLYYTT